MRRPWEQRQMIHEAAHAWLDIRVAPLMVSTFGLRMLMFMTTKLTSETIAYIAGSLFYLYHTRPAGGSLPKPDWATRGRGVHVESYKIAENIWNKPGIHLSQADVKKLQDEIKIEMPHIGRDPGMLTGYGGL